ncbi:unnamed protein product [Lota lota]
MSTASALPRGPPGPPYPAHAPPPSRPSPYPALPLAARGGEKRQSGDRKRAGHPSLVRPVRPGDTCHHGLLTLFVVSLCSSCALGPVWCGPCAVWALGTVDPLHCGPLALWAPCAVSPLRCGPLVLWACEQYFDK